MADSRFNINSLEIHNLWARRTKVSTGAKDVTNYVYSIRNIDAPTAVGIA